MELLANWIEGPAGSRFANDGETGVMVNSAGVKINMLAILTEAVEETQGAYPWKIVLKQAAEKETLFEAPTMKEARKQKASEAKE